MKRMSASMQRGSVTLAIMLAAALIAVLPALPAAAGDADVAFQGTATFGAGFLAPCSSNVHDGSLDVTVAGVHGGSAAVAGMSAGFLYCNSTTIAGTAEGTFGFGGDTCDFEWVRTGIYVAITFSGDCDGSATAVFGLTSVPGATPGTAELDGAGSWTH